METLIISKDDKEAVKRAAEALKSGEVVSFPTETVYGLGADAFNGEAVKKIFELKGRPADNPLIVHISDVGEAERIGRDIPEIFYKIAAEFWPGPLSMIVKKGDKIPDEVSAGLDTVAIRMPASEPARELISLSGCPVAAPSANISGTVSATRASYVYDDFKGKIPYIIDGGSCSVGIESTVIDLTSEPPVILRPGGITAEALEEAGVHAVYHPSITQSSKEVCRPASPGMKYKHYSPSCEVDLVCGNTYLCQDYILRNLREGDFVIAFSEQEALARLENSSVISSVKDPEKAAGAIFDDFRKADKDGVKRIFLSSVEEKGMGISYMNRVRKSAAGNIKNLKKIIFVCSGNTCRSPMAEYLMKAALPSLEVCSRGIFASDGSKMSFNSEYILKSYGIYTDDFRSKTLTAEDIDGADLIYTMTEEQKKVILRERPEADGKVFTLKLAGDISDPFLGGAEQYEKVFYEILNEIRRITQHG